MLAALSILIAQTPAQEARLVSLSKARADFERSYVSPKSERLQVVEMLGTSNLGNPGRAWYFPAKSASHRIWLTDFGDSGWLVYQSWHGKKTTTDWVLKLAAGRKGAKATGTVSKLVAGWDMRVTSPISPAQKRVLAAKIPYIGMTEGRGPYQGEIYTWFEQDGSSDEKRTHWWRCDPTVTTPTGSTTDMGLVLFAPPILPEEAELMGIKLKSIWKGKGKYTAELVPMPGRTENRP